MWETWVQSLGWEDSLEKEMATHSSILAWRIPWTEERPWGLKESDTTERLHFTSHIWSSSDKLRFYSNQRKGQVNLPSPEAVSMHNLMNLFWMVLAQWVGLTPNLVCLSPHTERLKKPKVTRSLGLTKDGICKITLTCSVEDSGHNVTYGWTPLPKGAVISQGGAHLSISWRSGEKHPNFTCTASNPVSNSSRQFLSRDLCPGCSPSLFSQTSELWVLGPKSFPSEWFFMKCSKQSESL